VREDRLMQQSHPVTTWLKDLKLGDPAAAQRLWEAYYERLVRLARRKLANAPRRVADEEDVALAAFHSFCRGVGKGRFPRLEDRNDLWQILLMVTARKACDQKQQERRQKRGGGRVRGESAFTNAEGSGGGFAAIAGREPTPEFSLLVAEKLDGLFGQLDEGALREIAMLKLEGYSNAEIADRLDCGLRSVERKLARIRAIWEEETG
jgi:DNA-directed RNA polymerase specialized sigma24 family protein